MTSSSNNQVNLDIQDDNSPTEDLPTNLPRRESGPRLSITNRTNPGLGDRLNHVIREIRPLMEQRMANNRRLTLTTLLIRAPPQAASSYSTQSDAATSPTLQSPHSSTTINMGPGAQTYPVQDRAIPSSSQRVNANGLGMGLPSLSTESNLNDHSRDSPVDINVSINPSNNNNIPDNGDNDSQSDDGTQQILDLRALINVLIKYSPFYLILLFKFMYDRREGLFTFVLLYFTFYHSDAMVKREYGKQSNRSMVSLIFELIYTVGCVVMVHFLFGHGKLLSNLVLFPPYTEPIDFFELLWLVALTDLIVKIITIDVKILFTMVPASLVPFQKRGKVYLFIESTSQLYRSILPIQPWLYYLMESYQGSEKMVGMFLSAGYVIAKGIELLVRFKLFKQATWTLLQSVNLGTKPSGEQLLAAGESCPICHDEFSTPVRLGCTHVFCEACIAAWLDRDHTCPLCRAKVADEPTWRDGSTTHYFQLY